jgi:peptide/nickel transport system ATP-binding protein
LAVDTGETFGLVGESGSGKSTLARIVVALEAPTSGEVRIGGTDLSSLSGRRLRQARRSIQPVFQDSFASLDPRMRVGPIIGEPLAAQGVGTRDERRARVAELLVEVGLGLEVARRHPHELSGGQRQRVALARALALRPQLIVADEPVSALDVSVRAQILNLMNELQRSYRLTYLFISHDLSVVRYIANRIGVMYLGKLVEVGPSASVYARPAHPYTAGLIKAIPSIDAASAGRQQLGQAPVGELPSAINPPSGCRYRTRCPRAAERCATSEPTLDTIGVGHRVACHFPLGAPSGDM